MALVLLAVALAVPVVLMLAACDRIGHAAGQAFVAGAFVLVLVVERWGISDLGRALDPSVALVAMVRSPLGAAGVVALYSILLSEAIWALFWLASLRERSASRRQGERRV